jgi:hypothetical protein
VRKGDIQKVVECVGFLGGATAMADRHFKGWSKARKRKPEKLDSVAQLDIFNVSLLAGWPVPFESQRNHRNVSFANISGVDRTKLLKYRLSKSNTC